MELRNTLLDVLDALRAGVLVGREWLETGRVFRPLGDAYYADPYRVYAEFRERDPVHRSYAAGGWVLSRYADVEAALSDRRFSADERVSANWDRILARHLRKGLITPDEPFNPSMLRLDGDEHARLRGLVSKTFTPRAVRGWKPRIDAIVGECLDRIEGRSEAELIEELAVPLPVLIIAELLGVPAEDRGQFKHWSDEVTRGLGTADMEEVRASRDASRELAAYLDPIVEARRAEPRDDLISALCAAEEAGDRLSRDELYSTVTLLLVAGNETTTNLIGNAVLALLRNPDQLERLRAEPERIDDAVEELLRYDSPVQATTRFASEDLELAGQHMRRGEQVVLLLGSANRDPDHFADPDRLDIGRVIDRHLSFGLGRHFCLGSRLARLEAGAAIGQLIARQPGLKLASETIRWRPNSILRGVQALPVRL